MAAKPPRVAVRAVILHRQRLLLVNAWPDGRSALLCAPGGGVEAGASLPDNLEREVFEETGLAVDVGAPCLVNEFHDPESDFHQIEIFFRCTVRGRAEIARGWRDPGKVVTQHHWVRRQDLAQLRFKPAALADAAFGGASGISYDPLEPIVR